MSAISVIIPVYNVEPYLRECLDSVVNQTFRDLEIICINDGSTDGSPAILEEYAAKDRRIHILTKENGGAADARNAGLSIASGEYILFIDSDDYLDLNACQILYSTAVENGSEMVMFLLKLFGTHEGCTSEGVFYFPPVLTDNYEKIHYEFSNWQAACSNLIRRDFLDVNNIRFHKEVFFEDVPFIAKASLLANRIAVVPKPLYYYRQRDDSKMGDRNKINHLSRPQCFRVMFEDISSIDLDNNTLLYLLTVKYNSLYNTYYNIIDDRYRSEMERRVKESVTDEERKLIIANEKLFDPKVFSFFVKHSGLTMFRWKYNCKCVKGKFFDWFAKRLIPFSPWLQNALEIVDSQREQIQRLQEQLENSKNE